MFLFSIILTVIFMVVTYLLPGGLENLLLLLDIPGLFLLTMFVIAVLVGSGLIKDFNRAFRMVLSNKKDYRMSDIKKSILAVKMAIYSGFVSGGFTFAVGLNISFHYLYEIDMLAPTISVSMLSFVYPFTFALLLMPVVAKLKHMLIEYTEIEDTEEEKQQIREI